MTIAVCRRFESFRLVAGEGISTTKKRRSAVSRLATDRASQENLPEGSKHDLPSCT
jgi:hypothetical protein